MSQDSDLREPQCILRSITPHDFDQSHHQDMMMTLMALEELRSWQALVDVHKPCHQCQLRALQAC